MLDTKIKHDVYPKCNRAIKDQYALDIRDSTYLCPGYVVPVNESHSRWKCTSCGTVTKEDMA